ncbi:hypothetical protein CL617_05010 [archaeon]|jgi:hypothetical protein|nr:hypothetical protein [archaeon]
MNLKFWTWFGNKKYDGEEFKARIQVLFKDVVNELNNSELSGNPFTINGDSFQGSSNTNGFYFRFILPQKAKDGNWRIHLNYSPLGKDDKSKSYVPKIEIGPEEGISEQNWDNAKKEIITIISEYLAKETAKAQSNSQAA